MRLLSEYVGSAALHDIAADLVRLGAKERD
jgi:hypothetical protein